MPTIKAKKRQYLFPGKLKILARFGTMANAAASLNTTTESIRRAAKGQGCRLVAEQLRKIIPDL
jgi:hypothetical protein